MMNSYVFSFRRWFFWKKIKAIGHRYDSNSNRMDVYHTDGSILSLADWNKYDLKLGTDWVLFTKKQMEKESGQKIDLDLPES